MNDLLKALMSPAPLTEELRDELQRVERALAEVTLEEFFRIMMDYHLSKVADSVRGVVAERISQAKQAQRAVIAATLEGRSFGQPSTPFDDEDEEIDDDDDENACFYCDGDGEVQCHECGGSGYRSCEECGGTGDA